MAIKFTIRTIQDYATSHRGQEKYTEDVFQEMVKLTDGYELEANGNIPFTGDQTLRLHYYTSLDDGIRDLFRIPTYLMEPFIRMTDDEKIQYLWEHMGTKANVLWEGAIFFEYAEVPYTAIIKWRHRGIQKLGSWRLQAFIDEIKHMTQHLAGIELEDCLVYDRKLKPVYRIAYFKKDRQFKIKKLGILSKLYYKLFGSIINEDETYYTYKA